MATVHQTIKLLKQWHYQRLNSKEKQFVSQVYDGLDGMGEVSDFQVKDYLTTHQEIWVRAIGKRFLITSKTKV